MFTVIQDQQQLPVAQEREQTLQDGVTRMPYERALIEAYNRVPGNRPKLVATAPPPAAASAPASAASDRP